MRALDWLRQSNRWKHLIGGFAIGVAPASWFAGLYGGVLAASALEYKDRDYGNGWDWADWALTVAGAAIGCLARAALRLMMAGGWHG